MGNHFTVIADVEASEAEAPELAASTVSWLISEGIIGAEPADCVPGADSGYPPGPNYPAAVAEPDEHLDRLRANGVEVNTDRTVFDAMGWTGDPKICPRCGQVTELRAPETGTTPQWELLGDALDAWAEGGPAEMRCLKCGKMTSINGWHWEGEPLVVGYLGFTFWNWPPLTGSFIAQMARRLGHQPVVIYGKV